MGLLRFFYDGNRIKDVVIGQETANFTPDPAHLVGRHPRAVFRDAGWRDTLVDLLGEAEYRRTGDAIVTSSPFVVQGDWVVGDGFNTSLVEHVHGAIAFHTTDGRILVALNSDENGLQLWGDPQGAYPEMIQAVIEHHSRL